MPVITRKSCLLSSQSEHAYYWHSHIINLRNVFSPLEFKDLHICILLLVFAFVRLDKLSSFDCRFMFWAVGIGCVVTFSCMGLMATNNLPKKERWWRNQAKVYKLSQITLLMTFICRILLSAWHKIWLSFYTQLFACQHNKIWI